MKFWISTRNESDGLPFKHYDSGGVFKTDDELNAAWKDAEGKVYIEIVVEKDGKSFAQRSPTINESDLTPELFKELLNKFFQ